jgi:hypothetical protein
MRGQQQVAKAAAKAEGVLTTFAESLVGLTCRVFGHKWVELPKYAVRAGLRTTRAGHAIHFRCKRCHTMAGFTNESGRGRES